MKINKRGLNAELGKQVTPIIRKRMHSRILIAAREAEQALLAAFDAHPVTREIEAGPGATNTSGTLGGYGNLFTFIGFNDSDNPIEAIRALLKNSVQVKILPADHRKMIQNFVISLPSKAEIEAAAPMPWAGGRSWVEGIEKGISGLGNYINSRTRDIGRSGSGTQTEDSIRGASFRSTPYLSQLLNQLQETLRRAIRI